MAVALAEATVFDLVRALGLAMAFDLAVVSNLAVAFSLAVVSNLAVAFDLAVAFHLAMAYLALEFVALAVEDYMSDCKCPQYQGQQKLQCRSDSVK